MLARFDGLLARFDGLLARFDGLLARFDGLLARFDGLLARFDGLLARFDGLLARFDGLLARFDGLLARFDVSTFVTLGAKHQTKTISMISAEFTLINKKTSCLLVEKRWLGTESNRRHTDFQSVALPTELPSHMKF